MDKSKLKNYILQNKTTREIAHLESKSQSTIKYWLKKYNLKTNFEPCGQKRIAPPLCRHCGETNTNAFMNNGTLGKSNTLCKQCHNKKTIERFKYKKQKAVNYKGGKCENCGYSKSLAALHFHHIDPNTKSPDFRKMKSWAWNKIVEELDKCLLLCANCHAEIHEKLVDD